MLLGDCVEVEVPLEHVVEVLLGFHEGLEGFKVVAQDRAVGGGKPLRFKLEKHAKGLENRAH